jgi:3alpha(or 20beta)-hydroxysteroid dehydrogenase
MQSRRFAGRVFLLSGAARGLGGAQARRIVADGGSVVIGDVLPNLAPQPSLLNSM